MPSNNHPSFINLGGSITFAPPYQITDTKLYGFLIESANPESLTALCRKTLNTHPDRQYDYIVLSPYFLVTFAQIAKISFTNHVSGQESQIGWVSEINMSIWLLTAAIRRGAVPVVERLGWYVPYMFVDNQYSLATGREVFGFPKEIGQFRLPPDRTAFDECTVETLAWQNFGLGNQATIQPLLQIHPKADSQGTQVKTASSWSTVGEAYKEVLKIMFGGQQEIAVPGLRLIFNLFDYILKKETPMVFLKQFRDINDCSKACYQAITEAPFHLAGWPKMGRLPGDFQLTIHHCDSHPIATDLGIASNQPIKVSLAFWAEFDSTLSPGKEVQVWR